MNRRECFKALVGGIAAAVAVKFAPPLANGGIVPPGEYVVGSSCCSLPYTLQPYLYGDYRHESLTCTRKPMQLVLNDKHLRSGQYSIKGDWFRFSSEDANKDVVIVAE